MTAPDRRVTAQHVNEADGVLDGLREALTAVGITLPSLRVHPGTWSDGGESALIDLGACNLDTARKLSSTLLGRRQ